MDYLTVNEIASLWGISPRSVRNYCLQGRVSGAQRIGKSWLIPRDAIKPQRKRQGEPSSLDTKEFNANTLLNRLQLEQRDKVSGGLYHKVQIELTYNSNHMEGSRLSHEQTRSIFETKTLLVQDDSVRTDDIVETLNHFKAVDYAIEHAEVFLTEGFIKHLHLLLKQSTSDAAKSWFAVGAYKQLPNIVGGHDTTSPEDVPRAMRNLLSWYSATQGTFEDLLEFHVRFERIHPFQDGNGRVGRLILFKECLAKGIVPFIISDDVKAFYLRGLDQWGKQNGYLTDTCLAMQDDFKSWLDYFRIEY